MLLEEKNKILCIGFNLILQEKKNKFIVIFWVMLNVDLMLERKEKMKNKYGFFLLYFMFFLFSF